MPAWLYVCKSCGSTHEAPLRPGGTVYLRCLTTREWSWYEPTGFTLPGEPRVRAGARVGSSRAGAPRKGTAAAPRRGSGTARAARRPAAARAARKTAARRVPRGGRKKRR